MYAEEHQTNFGFYVFLFSPCENAHF